METMRRECKLDDEWVTLLKEAKALGLSTEEVKRFLQKNQKQKKTV
ncbi:anti-repressor SinI family protein [Halobacillus aidingensis]|uniref:Antagonist of SinR n=1 Tax=Halobacillus aidingensis TaxID=240303 RepID=A0A1H0KQJ1_HALAD|nr:anti-repressor SinI family protein [Halobacillus aidingensis]SDO58244.1 antagonist of SinR [Halobacillus aidingensis]